MRTLKTEADPRRLTDRMVDLVKEGQDLEERCLDYINKLKAIEGVATQDIDMAKTHIRRGFVWTLRGIVFSAFNEAEYLKLKSEKAASTLPAE